MQHRRIIMLVTGLASTTWMLIGLAILATAAVTEGPAIDGRSILLWAIFGTVLAAVWAVAWCLDEAAQLVARGYAAGVTELSDRRQR